ncbi:hypothetical protein [Methylobacterium nodulans]|uniref:hypothetical protein n=1 Tax=Methylobacterium nodulans TaxID=114616 RepID=UPI0012EEA1D3|nr:hypothetical protein [Methylobacterium nodulans]
MLVTVDQEAGDRERITVIDLVHAQQGGLEWGESHRNGILQVKKQMRAELASRADDPVDLLGAEMCGQRFPGEIEVRGHRCCLRAGFCGRYLAQISHGQTPLG